MKIRTSFDVEQVLFPVLYRWVALRTRHAAVCSCLIAKKKCNNARVLIIKKSPDLDLNLLRCIFYYIVRTFWTNRIIVRLLHCDWRSHSPAASGDLRSCDPDAYCL